MAVLNYSCCQWLYEEKILLKASCLGGENEEASWGCHFPTCQDTQGNQRLLCSHVLTEAFRATAPQLPRGTM